jgi:hypothetical protein
MGAAAITLITPIAACSNKSAGKSIPIGGDETGPVSPRSTGPAPN